MELLIAGVISCVILWKLMASARRRKRRDLEGKAEVALTELGHVAACVLARAIGCGVFHATALPYPGAMAGWHQRFGGLVPGS